MTPHLYSPLGVAAMIDLLARPALMAFDFDGTLAPIGPDPKAVSVDSAWQGRLRRIGQRWPLAVISGRRLADLQPRLGFQPAFVVGNHGAESDNTALHPTAAARLDAARHLLALHQHELDSLGIVVEDKGLSLAVHYRNAPAPADAALLTAQLLAMLPAYLTVSHGRAVFNITVRSAPDKGDALRQAMQAAGVTRALYVGDDVNDEPAFAAASGSCVTVRIGATTEPSQARFTLGSQRELAPLLRWLAAQPA